MRVRSKLEAMQGTERELRREVDQLLGEDEHPRQEPLRQRPLQPATHDTKSSAKAVDSHVWTVEYRALADSAMDAVSPVIVGSGHTLQARTNTTHIQRLIALKEKPTDGSLGFGHQQEQPLHELNLQHNATN